MRTFLLAGVLLSLFGCAATRKAMDVVLGHSDYIVAFEVASYQTGSAVRVNDGVVLQIDILPVYDEATWGKVEEFTGPSWFRPTEGRKRSQFSEGRPRFYSLRFQNSESGQPELTLETELRSEDDPDETDKLEAVWDTTKGSWKLSVPVWTDQGEVLGLAVFANYVQDKLEPEAGREFLTKEQFRDSPEQTLTIKIDVDKITTGL